MAAEEEDEVDIEGIEDDGKTIDYKDIIENTPENHFNSKANLENTAGTFYSEFCDSTTWCLDPNSVLSLEHCEDEKSRATIEKMIMEEELYSHGYGRMLEVPTTPLQSACSLIKTSQSALLGSLGKNKMSWTTKKAQISPKAKKSHVNPENLSSTHRKPWTKEEQQLFEQGLAKYGRSWTRIASMITSRTVLQVKNYANQYFKNKDKLSTASKQPNSLNNGNSEISGFERNSKQLGASPSPAISSSIAMETKGQVDTGPLVHIEKTVDEEDIEVDIDGDSEEEVVIANDQNESTDDVYEALLKSVSDTEESSSDTEENKPDYDVSPEDHSKDGAITTTEITEIRDKNEKTPGNGYQNLEYQSNGKDCSIADDQIENTLNIDWATNESPDTLRDDDTLGNVLPEAALENSERFVLKSESDCGTSLEKVAERSTGNNVAYLSKELENSDSFTQPTEKSVTSQPCSTVGEVTSNIPTSTEERRPDLEDIKIGVNLVLVRDEIHDLEKTFNEEFFMGRSLKTPQRYIKIRNHILDMWNQTKPNYLYKTSVRSGLRNCGDVNSIGRVHAFLEEIGAINVGCAEKPRARPRQTFEVEKVEETPPMESWTSFLRPRKRRVRYGEGDWIDESQSEGLTISHFPGEEDEEPAKQTQDKVTHKKPRVPRSQPSYNPFLLVPCRRFPSASAVPFEVLFQSDALVVIDVHSHLSTTEVIGLLGGTYCATERVLKILRAAPCKSLSTGMQCEMDPVSQTQASEELSSHGLSVVGWYHSHPTFAPSPSVRDIETQAKFQEWFGKGGAPFIGVIASPYNYTNTSNQSQITTLTVSDEWETAGQYRLPYQFDYQIQEDVTGWVNVVDCVDELEVQYRGYKYRMPLTRRYSSSSFTALDKLVESLRPRLRGSEDEKQDFISELRNIFTSEFDSWSTERGQENSTKNTDDVHTELTNNKDVAS